MKPDLKNPIVIRMGAAHYDMTVLDETAPTNLTVDLSKLSREDSKEFRKAIVEAWSARNGINAPKQKRRRRKTTNKVSAA